MKKMNVLFVLLIALTIYIPATLSLAATKSTKENAVVQMEKININTSNIELLTSLPGIGPKTAQNILAYRTENGKFKTVEDLMNIKGIGEKSLKKMKPYLTL